MAQPFFSILIPTKNRSEILAGAINSALQQTDQDFEIIVSDNDDSPTATRDTVHKISDPRIRYFRTSGKLAMHENWDNAFSNSEGLYVLVLEDKMRLVPNALSILRENVVNGYNVISFAITFSKLEILGPAKTPVFGDDWKSVDIVDDFTNFLPNSFARIPKGLDCCAERLLLKQIKNESPTGFLFSHVCPDYSFGFMLLSRIEHVRHLKTPLIYVPNNWMWTGKYSNGQATYKKNAVIKRFIEQLPINKKQIVENVPVKAEFLWINMVLFDFFTKYKKQNHKPEINWSEYHAFVMSLILLGKKLGGDMTDEKKALQASLNNYSFLFKIGVYLCFLRQLFRNIIRALENRLSALKK